MEKAINKKIETYISQFKESIKSKITELGFEETTKANELLEYVYEHPRLVIERDDFVKRKRVKNSIPGSNRCDACRANGEQCTRRRKTGHNFCGTHYKGLPNGTITNDESKPIENQLKPVELFTEDINGIVYYLDHFKNVYNISDVMQKKENPRIIALYEKGESGYKISKFL
jgi:hypothetical protein